MDYVENVHRAVDYMERHLNRQVTLERAADQACYSLYHFSRIFHGLCGETPGTYLRKRRLTEAGRELRRSRRRILDLAVDYQFQSQEAFTRSFKELFGVPPGRYRQGLGTTYSYPPLDLEKLKHLAGGVSMDPRIEDRKQILLAGCACYGDNSNSEFSRMWDIFLPLVEHVPGVLEQEGCYGLEFYTREFVDEAKWFYMAAAAVRSLDELPMELVGKVLPANRYAVFTHRGPVRNLPTTFGYIYRTWLPKSGYSTAGSYDFEFYDARFRGPEAEDSEIDIYVPVVKR